jgi:hypothetical protein
MTPFRVQCYSVTLATAGLANCHRMHDCRDNGDPVQLTFFKRVIGAPFSTLAVIPSELQDYFPCSMLHRGVGGYGISELPPNTMIAKTMGTQCN